MTKEVTSNRKRPSRWYLDAWDSGSPRYLPNSLGEKIGFAFLRWHEGILCKSAHFQLFSWSLRKTWYLIPYQSVFRIVINVSYLLDTQSSGSSSKSPYLFGEKPVKTFNIDISIFQDSGILACRYKLLIRLHGKSQRTVLSLLPVSLPLGCPSKIVSIRNNRNWNRN